MSSVFGIGASLASSLRQFASLSGSLVGWFVGATYTISAASAASAENDRRRMRH